MADPVAADFALNMIKASKAAKKSLIDGAHLDIKNLKSLKMRCEWAFKMGFDGKAAMHPNQIPLINKEMMPSTQAIKEAEKMVEVYEKGSEVSSFVPHQNGFITPPKYRAAKLFLKKWREK